MPVSPKNHRQEAAATPLIRSEAVSAGSDERKAPSISVPSNGLRVEPGNGKGQRGRLPQRRLAVSRGVCLHLRMQQLPGQIDQDQSAAAEQCFLQQQTVFDHKADAPKAGQRQADVKEGDDACSDEGNA